MIKTTIQGYIAKTDMGKFLAKKEVCFGQCN